jgi:hypothetical protein
MFALALVAGGGLSMLTAVATPAVSYDGPAKMLVASYKSDVDAFGKQYNKKLVHVTGALVTSVTLPDAKSGAPWLISLKDETDSGDAANVSCFVSGSLSASEKQRALAVRKTKRIDIVGVVEADGYSLGITSCKVVPSGLVMGGGGAASGGRPAAANAAAAPARTATPFTYVVTNAWNDSVNGVLFVHDAIAITGGDNDVTLQPDDFVIAMHLANGALKKYPSMTQPAPKYQKYNPADIQNPLLVPEVDVKEDLGSIGTMTIPAHGSVRIVVTFQVVDSVANPQDNRTISLR